MPQFSRRIVLALAGERSPLDRENLRRSLRDRLHAEGVDTVGHGTADGASEALITFYRSHDVAFRVRRLRFLARRLSAASEQAELLQALQALGADRRIALVVAAPVAVEVVRRRLQRPVRCGVRGVGEERFAAAAPSLPRSSPATNTRPIRVSPRARRRSAAATCAARIPLASHAPRP